MAQRKKIYPNLQAYIDDCKLQGIRQGDVAARLGMSHGYFSDLRQGRVRPSLAMAKKLSDECGVPIESFLE